MTMPLSVRAIAAHDHEAWLDLWNGYNAFYGRKGPTALEPLISAQTWSRLLDETSQVTGLVAESDGRVVGIAHCVIHPSTSRLQDVCYLQDLYTAPALRGHGIGRTLIEHVTRMARTKGCCRVYWQTQSSNVQARGLYDQVAQNRGFIVYTCEL